MDIKELEAALNELSGHAYPVDSWKPAHQGTIDMVIKPDGTWLHEGDPIIRDKLVVLFSKILTKSQGSYFLVTPGEKLAMTVEDAPFLVVDFDIEEPGAGQTIWLITNIGDKVPLSKEYTIELRGEEQRPYLTLWRGLDALIERNTYYQLIDNATEKQTNKGTEMQLVSQQQCFSLGRF